MARFHLERLCLTTLTLGVWALVPCGTFQYDDFPNIVLEPSTFELARASGLRWLTRLSYFADASVWGMRAHGFLLTNLLLHLGSVLCVHSLAAAPVVTAAGRFRPPHGAAFVGAALFALQPANAEVVAYASGRATGLMTLLLLAGLTLRAHGRRRAGLAAFVLACLAKEVAVVFPLLVWLRERDARELARSSAVAFAVLAVLVCIPRYRELAGFSLAARDPLAALQLNLSVLPTQLSLWFRPWALSVEHAVDFSPELPAIGAGIALLCAMALGAFAARRRAPAVAFAIGWVLVALLPTSSLVARADPISERALYLAFVGPAIALGDTLARMRPLAPRLAAAAVLGLLAGSAVGATARVDVWSDPRLLWADALKKAPSSARAWNNLGMAYFARDEFERAREAFRHALAIDPRAPRARENLHALQILCGRRCP